MTFTEAERAALLATAETLEDPSKVVRDPENYAEDEDGRCFWSPDERACRWCVMGAAERLGATRAIDNVLVDGRMVVDLFTAGKITASEAALAIRAALEEEG